MSRRRDRSGGLPAVRRKPTTNPVLAVTDMAAATEFYERLGFDVVAHDGGYGWVTHSGWEWFHLRRAEPAADACAAEACAAEAPATGAGAYLHVDDPDAWRQAMADRSGGEIEITAVETMPWGMREFALVDPDGNQIRIGCNT